MSQELSIDGATSSQFGGKEISAPIDDENQHLPNSRGDVQKDQPKPWAGHFKQLPSTMPQSLRSW